VTTVADLTTTTLSSTPAAAPELPIWVVFRHGGAMVACEGVDSDRPEHGRPSY
jgi:hypothetical protein